MLAWLQSLAEYDRLYRTNLVPIQAADLGLLEVRHLKIKVQESQFYRNHLTFRFMLQRWLVNR